MKKLSAVFLLTFFCCKLFAQSNIPSYVPTNGLVGWWPFNGNANDESGNGNNGVVNGAALTIDRFGNVGKAFEFDGLDDNVLVQNSSSLMIFGDITMSAWVNTKGYDQIHNYQTIISKRQQDYEWQYWMGISYHFPYSHATKTITSRGNGPGNQDQVWSQTPVNTNTWEHWICVYSGTEIRIYRNGILDISGFNDVVTPVQNGVLLFGQSVTWNTNEQFFGSLDDIAIYNRALTQQEITALYTGQSTNNTNTDTTANITKPVPPGIPYQAVIRNASGQIMTNANVTAQFTLHKDSAIGGVEYQEVHSLTTNGHGLINTVLGKGTATQGTFASINWANTNKFLQVQMDLGNGYVDLGTQQLMSVPYALYAANGPKGEKGDVGPQGPRGLSGGFQHDGTSVGEMQYWNGTDWIAISPGQYGQSLVFCDGVPSWGGCLPKITGNQITDIYSNIATTGGIINNDGGSFVIARGVCWSTNPNPTIDLVTKTNDGSGKGSFTSIMTGLMPLTTYYVRAYATNDLGTMYGEQKMFTTNIVPYVTSVTFTYAAWTGDCATDGVQTRTYTRDPVDSINSFPPADSVRRFCPGALNNIVGTFMITADTVFVYDIATSSITHFFDVYSDTSFNPLATLDDHYIYGPAGTGNNFIYDEMGTIRPTGWGTYFYPLNGYNNWSIQNSTSLHYGLDYWGRIAKINSAKYVLFYFFPDNPNTPSIYYLRYTTFTKQP